MKSLRSDDIRQQRNEQGSPADVPVIDLRELFRTLWSGKTLIALVTVLALALGAFAVLRIEPGYTAATQVLLAADAPSGETDEAEILSEQRLATEVEIIYSTSVLGAVVDTLGLAELMEPALAEEESSGGLDATLTWVSTLLGWPDGAETGNENAGGLPSPRRLAVDLVRDQLGVTQLSESRVISLAFTAEDPVVAADLSNAIARQYIDDRTASRRLTRERQIEALAARVETLREELGAAEEAVTTREAALAQSGEQTLDMLVRDLELRASELAQSRSDIARLSLTQERLTEAIARGIDLLTVPEFRADPSLAQTGERLRDMRDRLDALPAGNPARAVIEAQISNVERDMRNEAERVSASMGEDLEAARERERFLGQSVRELETAVRDQRSDEADLRQLRTEAEVARQNYQDLLRDYLRREGGAPTQPDTRILSLAEPPFMPDRGRETIILLFAAVSGLLFGSAIVVGREQWSSGFRSIADLERTTGHRVLAVLPRVRRSLRRMTAETPRTSDAALSEAVRRFSVALLGLTHGGPPQMVMIVPARGGDGASTLAELTAARLQRLGRSCLLVSCDMRSAAGAGPGLHSVLSGAATLAEAIQTDPDTGVRRLDVETNLEEGTDQNAIFHGGQFRALAGKLRAEYDTVLIDAPSLSAAPELRLIAPLAEVVLVVARWNSTPRTAVTETLAELTAAGAPLGGVVLNAVAPRALRGSQRHAPPRPRSAT